jgi:hypothetical protein
VGDYEKDGYENGDLGFMAIVSWEYWCLRIYGVIRNSKNIFLR